jgi:hypothetical protein
METHGRTRIALRADEEAADEQAKKMQQPTNGIRRSGNGRRHA